MTSVKLNIPQPIEIITVSTDRFFLAILHDTLKNISGAHSCDKIQHYRKISEIDTEKFAESIKFLVIDVNSRDIEQYFEFVRKIKSINGRLLTMLILKIPDADKLDQIQSEIAVDDVMVYDPDNISLLRHHLMRNLKFMVNHLYQGGGSMNINGTCAADDDKLRQLKAALDNTAEGILITDTDNNIWYMNEAFGYLFAYTMNTLHEIDFYDIVQMDREERTVESDRDVTAKRRDGKEFPCNIKFTEIMNDEFEVIGKIFIFSDLTERIQAEEKRQEMAKFYGVIEMAGAAAHEINQPLQAISMISEFLIMQSDETDANYQYYQNINNQCQRIGKITVNIQKIAKHGDYKTKDYVAGEKIVDIFSVDSDEKEAPG